MSAPFPKFVEIMRALDPGQLASFLRSLSDDEAEAILSSWDLWRLPYQEIPGGLWRIWIFRAGRGTGKTHTGARTTTEVARDKRSLGGGEIGIIGRTYSDARWTMIEGPSGILATAPHDFRPTWEPGNGILTWPNGVRGRVYSADKPESIRGPNFAWVWGDEPCHWPDLEGTWDKVIEPALRKGRAQAMLTTTPTPGTYLRQIEARATSVVSRAHNRDNVYLPEHVRQAFADMYEGTSAGVQEMEGEYLPENQNALWRRAMIEDYRVKRAPDLSRIVIGVDPAVTARDGSDETGIIVAGIEPSGECYVLDDRSGIYTPGEWSREVRAAYRRWAADLVVAEVNNGGDLVESNILAADDTIPVNQVRASRGKYVRAEPVSALYERGKVHHVGMLAKLEDQLCEWEPTSGKSPDRLDALVWAITELALQTTNIGPLTGYL